jgi:hypothetical protein
MSIWSPLVTRSAEWFLGIKLTTTWSVLREITTRALAE